MSGKRFQKAQKRVIAGNEGGAGGEMVDGRYRTGAEKRFSLASRKEEVAGFAVRQCVQIEGMEDKHRSVATYALTPNMYSKHCHFGSLHHDIGNTTSPLAVGRVLGLFVPRATKLLRNDLRSCLKKLQLACLFFKMARIAVITSVVSENTLRCSIRGGP